MSDKVLVELFTRPIPEPALPPDHMQRLLARARRSRRLRRLRNALAALLAIIVASLAPGVLISPAGSDRVILPDRIDGYFPLTGTVSASAPGRSLLLFNSGSFERYFTYQTLVVGADGRTYRSLDLGWAKEPLLSPDGTMVIFCEAQEATFSLVVVDLTTGERRSIPLEKPRGVRLHAWSPDLRYVSYSTVETHTREASDFLNRQMRTEAVLSILDLRTGQSSRFPDLRPAPASAFTPDSRALAVQMDADQAWVVGLDGVKQRQVSLPSGYGIAPGLAWSPDGHTLAMVPWSNQMDPADARRGWGHSALRFTDANGVPLSDVKPVDGLHLLGWRSARSVIGFDLRTKAITELDLDTGHSTVLSRVNHGDACELFSQPCRGDYFQMAEGLIGAMTVEKARSPSRGPWPAWFIGTGLGCLVVIGVFVVLLASAVRRARRSSA